MHDSQSNWLADLQRTANLMLSIIKSTSLVKHTNNVQDQAISAVRMICHSISLLSGPSVFRDLIEYFFLIIIDGKLNLLLSWLIFITLYE